MRQYGKHGGGGGGGGVGLPVSTSGFTYFVVLCGVLCLRCWPSIGYRFVSVPAHVGVPSDVSSHLLARACGYELTPLTLCQVGLMGAQDGGLTTDPSFEASGRPI